MDKYFNVAGPCNPDIHYMLSATDRLPDVMSLIDQQLYFVLHAPRQTGKTTALRTLAQELTAAEKYTAVLVSMETGSAFNNNPGMAEDAILSSWHRATRWNLPADLQPPPWPDVAPGGRIASALEAWAATSPRPLDDTRFVQDLGLCRMSPTGGLMIANPIYQEVIPRILSYTTQASLPQISPAWLNPDGSLNPDWLLEAFLEFWREHGHALLKSSPYSEVAPQIVLMAFLHRVINASGTIIREYAMGKGSMDVYLRYGNVTLAMELKTWRDTDNKRDPLDKGLTQLDGYLAKLGLETGWLIIFDQRSGLPPIEERITVVEATTLAGRTVTVVRA